MHIHVWALDKSAVQSISNVWKEWGVPLAPLMYVYIMWALSSSLSSDYKNQMEEGDRFSIHGLQVA